MNIYAVIILVAILGRLAIELASLWLNIRSLSAEAPEPLAGLYDPEKYRKSQEYTRVHTRFGIVEEIFSLAVLLIFWFAGGFNWLDQALRGLQLSSIFTGVLYIGILVLAGSLLSVPFSLYSTFVIEERFGFNRTNLRTFVLDRMKGLALSALLGIPLLIVVLWFFGREGSLAWLYCWIIATLFTLAVQFIAPVWIMPLFNKFTPLPEGDLKDRVSEYAHRVRFVFKDISVMDGSKRSSKANAFFTGFGKNRRIALFDTLIEQQTVPELVAVLAHEIGHYKKGHVLQGMVIGVLHTGILFYLLSLFLNNRGLFDAFYVQHVSVYGSLLFFGLLYEPISFVLSILMNAFSRKHELEADRYAAQTVGDREEIVSALKKLSVRNLSNLTPHPFHVFLHYSHPPLLQRIRSIRDYRSS